MRLSGRKLFKAKYNYVGSGVWSSSKSSFSTDKDLLSTLIVPDASFGCFRFNNTPFHVSFDCSRFDSDTSFGCFRFNNTPFDVSFDCSRFDTASSPEVSSSCPQNSWLLVWVVSTLSLVWVVSLFEAVLKVNLSEMIKDFGDGALIFFEEVETSEKDANNSGDSNNRLVWHFNGVHSYVHQKRDAFSLSLYLCSHQGS